MRSAEEVQTVIDAFARGLSTAEVVRETGFPRSTVRNWRDGRTRALELAREACPACRQRCLPLPRERHEAYSYLLGQYLGDGGIYQWNISIARRDGVARLDEFVGPKR